MVSHIEIVAGLGNPGPEYARTRHNAGFMLADLIRQSGESSAWKSWRGTGEYCSQSLPSGRSFFLIRPMTFMNDSGRMTADFARFHKVHPEAVLVCFDDISLELGRIRIRQEGSAGGHRGMESVISAFSSQNIPRLRIGIGPRPVKADCKDFVLSAFSGAETTILRDVLENARAAVSDIIEKGFSYSMDRYNNTCFRS